MTTKILSSQQTKTEVNGISFSAVFTIFTGFIMLTALYLALIWAPDAVNLLTPTERYAQRIFYFHVPAAWVGFLAFLASALFSVIYLIKRQQKWDAMALSSVEVGLAFFTMVMLSGPIWAKPTWNVWWTWDPRLTISTICWLLYIGYIMLRGAIDNPEREARFAAVFAIVSSFSIPLNWLAIRWWRTIHPAIVAAGSNDGSEGGFGMSPDIRNTLIFCVVAFTIFYINLMYHRVKLELMKRRVELLKQDILYQ
ncbi:cytochrome c biogenesis protein CcsA [Anaerolineales bacterium HSG24]|nr:cytochrome c biogenesis protein CcsA [Anaerolineales bacterium HSG24]